MRTETNIFSVQNFLGRNTVQHNHSSFINHTPHMRRLCIRIPMGAILL